MDDKHHRIENFRKKCLLIQIETVIKDILYSIVHNKSAVLSIIDPKKNAVYDEVLSRYILNKEKIHIKKVMFGKKVLNFARYIYVLKTIYELLSTGNYITKRDVYYSNINLFESQIITDTIIENIAATFEVNRNFLHILSSEKGLVVGPLSYFHKDGKEISCDDQLEQYHPIPQLIDDIKYLKSTASYVLIVEKHTIFNKLVESKFHKLNNCILITGKGYPDLGTRKLIHRLHHELLLPVYALYVILSLISLSSNLYKFRVDADPHGIDILLTYCRGSPTNCYDSLSSTCPNIQWIGVFIDDIPEQAHMNLTKRDISIITKLLKDPFLSRPDHKKWYLEIEKINKKMKKAEVEGLSEINFDHLIKYLHMNIDIAKALIRER